MQAAITHLTPPSARFKILEIQLKLFADHSSTANASPSIDNGPLSMLHFVTLVRHGSVGSAEHGLAKPRIPLVHADQCCPAAPQSQSSRANELLSIACLSTSS
jgi:hypothetical protein